MPRYQGYFAYSVSWGVDVRSVPREMGRLLFASAEYAARGRANAQFITDNSEAFLHRALRSGARRVAGRNVDAPAGGVVIRGVHRVRDRLANSGGLLDFEECIRLGLRGRRDRGSSPRGDRQGGLGPGIGGVSVYESDEPDGLIRLYRAYLGRYPSSDEINYWTCLLNAHMQTTADVINAFAVSSEFTSRLNTFFGQV